MGRRKIEIQPITHERNRSVTFLKRKNGLFKKAYELGVLCSVDVAVVIFEERPGHHVKLYQYCSGNIDEIVQRHARYDGEKDVRTPGDFSNSSSAKLDDVAEGDDDDAEDDDFEPLQGKGNAGIKKGGDIKPRIEPVPKMRTSTSNTSDLDIDYLAHRPMAIPNPPMPMAMSSSSMSVSGERLDSATRISSGSGAQNSSGPNKKPRVSSNVDGRWSPQNDFSPTVPEYGYHPISAPHLYRGLHPNEQYASFFPTPQPFSSVPSFDYPPSRIQYRSMNYPPTRSMPPYSQHPDQHFMRSIHQQYQQHRPGYPPMMPSQQHPNDIFAAFLDGDPRQHPGQGFGPIDWPVHAPTQDGRPAHGQGDPNDVSWLDFLSGNVPPPSGSIHPSLPMPPSGRDNMSRERDASNGSVASRPPSRLSSTASDVAARKVNPHKRSRVDSEAGGGLVDEQSQDIDMKPPVSSAIQQPEGGSSREKRDSDDRADNEE